MPDTTVFSDDNKKWMKETHKHNLKYEETDIKMKILTRKTGNSITGSITEEGSNTGGLGE
jgi:hypothetical protein